MAAATEVPTNRLAETPDISLDDFPFHYSFGNVYADSKPTDTALRMAYIDERPAGKQHDGVVVLLHGEPTWSYLYRFMIPGLVNAGYRVIAPDLIGFGRSDKLGMSPASQMTVFVQDWGSLLGLRIVAEAPWAFARVVVGNGFLPTGDGKPSKMFARWLDFSQNTPQLPVGAIIASGTARQLAEHEVAAYDAPFSTEDSKEAARALPALVPVSPDQEGALDNICAWATLARFQRPFVTCFSTGDPITRGADALLQRYVAGARGQKHETLEGGHFLQEDVPQDLVRIILRTIRETPEAPLTEPLARAGGLPGTAQAAAAAAAIAAAEARAHATLQAASKL